MKRFCLLIVLVGLLGVPTAQAGGAPNFEMTEISPNPFYPLVRDGFKDEARVRYRPTQEMTFTARVRNPEGRMIRNVSLGQEGGWWHVWSWNGRTDEGDVVAREGRYEITLIGRADGQRIAKSRIVRVDTKTVRRWGSRTKRGVQTSYRDRKGNCQFWAYSGNLDLDCWGGDYALARWGLTLPRNTTKTGWSVRGRKGCCAEGVIQKDGWKATPRRMTIEVRVTRWSAYTVNRVKVTYQYLDRI